MDEPQTMEMEEVVKLMNACILICTFHYSACRRSQSAYQPACLPKLRGRHASHLGQLEKRDEGSIKRNQKILFTTSTLCIRCRQTYKRMESSRVLVVPIHYFQIKADPVFMTQSARLHLFLHFSESFPPLLYSILHSIHPYKIYQIFQKVIDN